MIYQNYKTIRLKHMKLLFFVDQKLHIVQPSLSGAFGDGKSVCACTQAYIELTRKKRMIQKCFKNQETVK